MKSLFALGWRFLLVFALVANPLAAAFAAPCHEMPAKAAGSAPPCHHRMAMADQAAKPSPSGMHGHDCSKAGCDFGACCASCVLISAQPAALLHSPLADVTQVAGVAALAGPPLPPLIRPPIA